MKDKSDQWMVMNINIGIDIGGNHTGIGIVDEKGNMIETSVINYENSLANIDDIFGGINTFLSEKSHKYSIDSIGIGIPGISTGTCIHYTCNLPLGNINVKDYIQTELPVYLSNDAKCAAIAEYQIIDKKAYPNYALVTIGTGIGSGLILNGKLYSGSSGSAGEIGHTVIEKDGLKCKCGRRGCFEQYASVTALKRMTGLDSLKEIFYLAENNKSIQNVLDQYFDNLSEGLANFINTYDMEMLVIGGGLSRFGEKFIPQLKEKISSKVCNKVTYELELKTAVLKNDAGIIGASLLSQY